MASGNEIECPPRGEIIIVYPCIFVRHNYVQMLHLFIFCLCEIYIMIY